MINVAVTGKGGVGKTTIAGVLSRLLARDGYKVLAVDADPDMNLGSALGVDTWGATPISEDRKLIAKRTGAFPGQSFGGGVFKLNPKVDDIASAYGIKAPDGVNLILMGTVKKGGTGCMCPADAFLRALLRHLMIRKGDAVVLDMEAGIEHLGRGTAESVNTLIVVVELGEKSLMTAERIRDLAEDLEIPKIRAVPNKTRSEEDLEVISDRLEKIGIPQLPSVPYDENFVRADLADESPLDYAEDSRGIRSIREIEKRLVGK